MEQQLTHIRENNSDTEQHLSENREKYETDGVFLIKLMKFGHRLTRQSVVEKYRIDGRRLGEIHSEGLCQKEWVLNENGKRLYVEYFITRPTPLTKSAVVINFMKKIGELKQTNLFPHESP